MRIVEFSLEGNGAWPDVRTGHIDESLNVFVGARETGKSTTARFLGHVLYGRRPAATGQPTHSSADLPEGELIVADGSGRFRLRRYNDVAPPGRLTVSSLDGGPVGKHTVRELLSQTPLSVLSPLYFADFRSSRALTQLLSEEFAHDFRSALGDREQPQHAGPVTAGRPVYSALLKRRDELARELESRVSQDRRQSRELYEQLRELEARCVEREQELKETDRQLHAVVGKLAEVEARLRYGRLDEIVEHEQAIAAPSNLQQRLADVDEQIERRRDTLAEIERREADLRSQLAQLHPDDPSRALSLADQLAHLAVLRRLLSDLHGELSLLARSEDSKTCACGDVYGRLQPLAETLEQQAGLLGRSLHEQQRLVEYQDLRSEEEHLARSKNELRALLDNLLAKRQSLLRAARPTRRRIARTSAPSGNGKHATPRMTDEVSVTDLENRRVELQRKRQQLRDRSTTVKRALLDLRKRCQDLTRDRAGLLADIPIERIRSEFSTIQAELQRQFTTTAGIADVGDSMSSTRSASGYLAQLTSGHFVQLELSRQARTLIIIDQQRQRVPMDELNAADRDLLQLSLSLALIGGHARHGIRLPLVLDEPFARLDERGTVAMASVLDEFARAGHQVLVFTGCPSAADRFRWLGAKLRDLGELRCASDAEVELSSTPGRTRVSRQDPDDTDLYFEKPSTEESNSKDAAESRTMQVPSTETSETRRRNGSTSSKSVEAA